MHIEKNSRKLRSLSSSYESSLYERIISDFDDSYDHSDDFYDEYEHSYSFEFRDSFSDSDYSDNSFY